LTARAEGALRHFFQDVVAADGFDDFFIGLVTLVFIVVGFVAMRAYGIFRCSAIARGRFSVLAVSGVVCLIGMSRVLLGVWLAIIMRALSMSFRALLQRTRGGVDGARR